MLDILLKHNFSFLGTFDLDFLIEKCDIEIFKWIIDNKIIDKKNKIYRALCKKLLNRSEQTCFEKFKYAFEACFPLSTVDQIKINDINIVYQIREYLDSKNIQHTSIIVFDNFENFHLQFLRERNR
uniref:Uncharacterized protein n=1 Tax=viral metagenome TaxID=1070528 RepID=A0A6C0ADP9_9ZZZZ